MDAPMPAGTYIAHRYRVLSLLGSGGMAHVYRALQVGLRREVALKVLPPEPTGTTLGERFEREARSAARLEHPGCVKVLDYGRWVDRSRFLVMELLDGPTLRAVLAREGPLEPARALRIARQVLTALAHAHRHGVLHRDVKPENVMFATRDGTTRPVLIDFGLAHVLGEGPLTAAGVCVGSPSYLAPERLLGRLYDGRADLYAVGVLLYEMLSGRRPFHGSSPEETALLQIQRAPVPLQVLGIPCPAPFWAVLARALAKDPRARFADAEAMLSALDDAPRIQQQHALARAAATADEESTAVLLTLSEARPSLLRRIWTGLRYGGWRWRADAQPGGSS